MIHGITSILSSTGRQTSTHDNAPDTRKFRVIDWQPEGSVNLHKKLPSSLSLSIPNDTYAYYNIRIIKRRYTILFETPGLENDHIVAERLQDPRGTFSDL